MINEKLVQKIEKTIHKDELKHLQDLSIFQDTTGSYQLFNKYTITKTNGSYEVGFFTSSSTMLFWELKNAVTWCTFDRRNKIMDSKRIVELDKKIARLDANISVHQRMVKNSKNNEEKLIYLAKLGEERLMLKRLTDELNDFILDSKSWHAKRFNTKSH
jgi:hypothetical protein